MNYNQIRPAFRIVTLLLSLASWCTIFMIVDIEIDLLKREYVTFDWFRYFTLIPACGFILVAGIAFTYTTIFGYMPQKLFTLLFGKSNKN